MNYEDITIGDQFKARYPIIRGDDIEFAEGVLFDVIEKSIHPDGADVWNCIRLKSHEIGYHWMGLKVPVPPHQPDYLYYLNVTVDILNKSFELQTTRAPEDLTGSTPVTSSFEVFVHDDDIFIKDNEVFGRNAE